MTGRALRRRTGFAAAVIIALAAGLATASPALADPNLPDPDLTTASPALPDPNLPDPDLADPGLADPNLAAARAKAARLHDQIADLEQRAELAVERYDEAQARLADVVSRHVRATRALDLAERARTDQRSTATARVRALYMSGGAAALYASVLDSRDITEALARAETVEHLISDDRTTTATTDGAAADAAADADQLGQLATARVDLQERATQAAAQVQALLAQSRALSAGTDAEVRRLAEEERQRREAERAAASAVELSRLGLFNSPAVTGSDAATGTTVALRAIAAARSRLGLPYIWGGTGPEGYDCSGLTQWAYRQAGVSIPRTARPQWRVYAAVPLHQLAPGDLLFWAVDTSDPETIHHVALYVGGGRMIEAPRPGRVIQEVPVYTEGLIGAVRPGTPRSVSGTTG